MIQDQNLMLEWVPILAVAGVLVSQLSENEYLITQFLNKLKVLFDMKLNHIFWHCL